MNRKPNIVLIGLMGAGKTSTGKILSTRLNYSFIDIDSIIEEREQCLISQIFETKGEAYFRRIETSTIIEFSEHQNLVISTGGGAPENNENIKHLKNNGILFYLYAPVDELFNRLTSEMSNRPMLFTANPQEKLSELLKRREPFYLKADFKIDTTNKTLEEVANSILFLL